ncbi:MAG: cation-translocating P-type ATPase [Saprospiraceae bacterium]|nr:cation-translocating P-type ATPase [Saprospiraceae bacterium]MBK8372271.1 cation-translocating P-type ATPase [Saprospiraceae bacterium]MBK8852959.1 cation-translocating P-type ATPase [Saprospiraceae bacterium]MBK9042739.1 cation-translocating P-type ATPase [Saprospiraceae bacterium]
MNKPVSNPYPFAGLTDEEVFIKSAQGISESKKSLWGNPQVKATINMVSEPMFILLVISATIYFILGEYNEAWFMTGAIILVSAISFYQEIREKKALAALQDYSQEKQKVIRNNAIIEIKTEELVSDDLVVCSEGNLIPADGFILSQNDFSVNESLLTGESLPVYKNMSSPELTQIFQGSQVTSGQCVMKIASIGKNTRLSQMGMKLDKMEYKKSPLQTEIDSFVTKMALIGLIFFVCICVITYFKTFNFTSSLLAGLTIAMSVLPEEIPVAFATFMALGAWRLIQKGIIVKKTDIVEALGSIRYLCLDKTGTITQNKMEMVMMYDFEKDEILEEKKFVESPELLEYAMWSSETEPFDQMEKSIHHFYKKNTKKDKRPLYRMIREYPLEGKPPYMTHVFGNGDGDIIIACKGAPEALITLCKLPKNDIERLEKNIHKMATLGYRILGVGKAQKIPITLPDAASEITMNFLGLIAFYDPPKPKINEFIQSVRKAGIDIKMITGDNPVTAINIGEKAGFGKMVLTVTQNELLQMDDATFDKTVVEYDIFARISPEVKLKIIYALQKSGLVAMTGDGVNDGLALKAANVGIAMGKKGTEIARLASSIILTDDKIEKIAEAVLMGRKIYGNLQKAIRYIISIHVPIILLVSIPLFFGWPYASIFSPIHIIFFEIIMGPTCSIVYENEPEEPGIMEKGPKKRTDGFISIKKLNVSIIQGLIITIAGLAVYKYGLHKDWSEHTIRTMIFILVITANITLTYANRSFYHSMLFMFSIRNNLLIWITGITIVTILMIYFIPSWRSFFELTNLSSEQFALSVICGIVSVLWFELYKIYKRSQNDID